MTFPSLGLLQNHLNEIYCATRDVNQNNPLNLYATSPHTICNKKNLMGLCVMKWNKMWRWIESKQEASLHEALKHILNTDFDQAVRCAYYKRQNKIWHYMHQIGTVLNTQLTPQDVSNQKQRYQAYLTNELVGSVETNYTHYLNAFDQKKILSHQEQRQQRQFFDDFYQATHDFWSAFIQSHNQAQILQSHLMPFIHSNAILLDQPLYHALQKEKGWLEVEGKMQQSIPVSLIAKLQNPQSLTIAEKKYLKLWVKTLNECYASLSPKVILNVLNEIIEIIHLEGSSSLTLMDFFYWLDQNECPIMNEEDPFHMDWRESLQQGDSINCNGKTLILGQQLSPDKLLEDVYKVFELVNFPDYVVKIANNSYRLLIDHKLSEHHWGFRLVTTVENLEEDDQQPSIFGLDQYGKCVVLEKLETSFQDHQWTSHQIQLSEEDNHAALVLANHLFYMIQHKASLKNFSLFYLMWNRQNELVSTRFLKKDLPNYIEYESILIEAAQNNLFVLNFLMHVSKLSDHPMETYFRNAIEYTLKTGIIDLIGRSLPRGHRYDHYKNYVQELCIQAQTIRKNVLKHIVAILRKRRTYSYAQSAQIHQSIIVQLIEYYRASPIAAHFPENFSQNFIQLFLNTQAIVSLDSDDAKRYYDSEHEKMMQYNRLVLEKASIIEEAEFEVKEE